MPAALLHLCHKMAIRAQWWISLLPLWRNIELLSPKCRETSPVFQGKKWLLEYPQTYIPSWSKELGGRIRIFALGWPVAVLRLGWHCPCSSWRKTQTKWCRSFQAKVEWQGAWKRVYLWPVKLLLTCVDLFCCMGRNGCWLSSCKDHKINPERAAGSFPWGVSRRAAE